MKSTILIVQHLPAFCSSFDVAEILTKECLPVRVLALQPESGIGSGKCYLEMNSDEDCVRAIQILKSTHWEGNEIVVKRTTSDKLFVAQQPEDFSNSSEPYLATAL